MTWRGRGELRTMFEELNQGLWGGKLPMCRVRRARLPGKVFGRYTRRGGIELSRELYPLHTQASLARNDPCGGRTVARRSFLLPSVTFRVGAQRSSGSRGALCDAARCAV